MINNTDANTRPLGLTEVVLRDGHQSLLATRFRIDDMLPIASQMDEVGYWSVESWGGATFDACIRYLGEDPWDRLRELKSAMPKTPQQMLLRGQNILGYRHYSDDVVHKFIERAAINGIDVFRIFDAMNNAANMRSAISATKHQGKHAQGTLAYTRSPVHTLESWTDLAKQLEDMGADSLCIKDMAGLLLPYDGYALVKALKACTDLPVHIQCHATTGLSTATYLKCIEAGIDNVDTSISSMSLTYGHTPTESIIALLQGQPRDTGLNLDALTPIAAHFREVRKRYAAFEGELKGIDARILQAQVPGGMLTNLENQLREQGALDRLGEVLEEVPRVRKELGYIPLVTPTSQIVGTQAVFNVLQGERYKAVSEETRGILRGDYGATPAPVDEQLKTRLLENNANHEAATGHQPELGAHVSRLSSLVDAEHLKSDEYFIDDVLIYTLFPQVGIHFLKNRGNPDAFEAKPSTTPPVAQSGKASGIYDVEFEGQTYRVKVDDAGSVIDIDGASTGITERAPGTKIHAINAPLGGNIIDILVAPGDTVETGVELLVMEAMKMETTIRSDQCGLVKSIKVNQGSMIKAGELLIELET